MKTKTLKRLPLFLSAAIAVSAGFCLLVQSGCASGSHPVYIKKEYPMHFFDKTSATPYLYLNTIRGFFDRYREKHGRYPSVWTELADEFGGEFDEICFSRGRGDRERSPKDFHLDLSGGRVFTTYDIDADRKYYFRYTIAESGSDGFRVIAESSYFPYIWEIDGRRLWHYYANRDEEDCVLSDIEKELNSFFNRAEFKRSLLNKLVYMRSEKALELCVRYLESCGDPDIVYAGLCYLRGSSMLPGHRPYLARLNRTVSRHADRHEKAFRRAEADLLSSVISPPERYDVDWRRIEDWATLVPYGRCVRDDENP